MSQSRQTYLTNHRFGGVPHVSSPGQRPFAQMRHGEGNVLKDQMNCERLGSSPLNSVECAKGAYKLTAEVVDFIEKASDDIPGPKAAELARQVHARFGLSLHPRSIEKALARKKKE